MRYIVFSRVSTGKQTTENQILECMKYVQETMKSADELLEFHEHGVSTRKAIHERPVLQSMLDSLKRGDTLVVYKLNRLARAGNEIVNIWYDLKKKGVNLVSLYEKQIDEMMIHAYAMVGQAERKNIQEATKSGLRRKQAKGEKVGSCLYGFTTDPTKLQIKQSDCHSYGKPYLLIPEEKENQQVELMVSLYQQGFSLGHIERQLCSQGFVNRKGNPPHKMTIFRTLKRMGLLRESPRDALSSRFQQSKQSSSVLCGRV